MSMAQNGNLAVVQQVMRQRCWIGLTHHVVGEIANPAALESMAMDKVVAVSTFSPEQIKQLKKLNLRRLKQMGTVVVTDLLPQAIEIKSN